MQPRAKWKQMISSKRHGWWQSKSAMAWYAMKLDRGWDQPEEESAGGALSKVLSGPESDDPLMAPKSH